MPFRSVTPARKLLLVRIVEPDLFRQKPVSKISNVLVQLFYVRRFTPSGTITKPGTLNRVNDQNWPYRATRAECGRDAGKVVFDRLIVRRPRRLEGNTRRIISLGRSNHGVERQVKAAAIHA